MDTAVSSRKSYRQIPTSCSGLQLDRPDLTPTAFRGLLSCLNGGGSLDAYQRLVEKLSDQDLQPLLNLINGSVLAQPERLFELQTTFRALKASGSIDRVLKQFGILVSNEDFVSSSVALLKEAYLVEGSFWSGRRADPKLLKALERLAPKLTPQNTLAGLNAGLTLASSSSYIELIRRMGVQRTGGRALEGLVSSAFSYLTSPERESRTIGRRLMQGLVDQSLPMAMDDALHSKGVSASLTGAEIRAHGPELARSFRAMTQNDAAILDSFNSLFEITRKPVSCLQGTQTVKDPALFIIEELTRQDSELAAHYLIRDKLLLLTAMGPACSYPAEMMPYYRSCVKLAETNAMPAAAKLLQAFDRRGQLPWLVDAMSDPSLKFLLPAMSELNDHGIWEDAVFAATLPLEEDRADIAAVAQFMIEPDQALGGLSIFDVLDGAVSRVSVPHLLTWVNSVDRFLKQESPILLPALQGLRSSYFATDVFPLLNVSKDLLAHASQNEALFTTLFKVSEMSEFKAAVKLTSEMASDDRLRDLFDTALSLFENFAAKGRKEIRRGGAEPEFVARRRHDLSSKDVARLEIEQLPELVQLADACSGIDLSKPLDVRDNGGPDSPMSSYLRCMNAGTTSLPGDPESMAALQFLRTAQTTQGDTYFNHAMDLAHSFASSLKLNGVTANLTDRLVLSMKDHRADRLVEALPLFLSDASGRSDSGIQGSFIEPILMMAGPILTQARAELHTTLELASKLIRHVDFPVALETADRLLKAQPDSDVGPLPDESAIRRGNVGFDNADLDKTLSTLIRTRECEADSSKVSRRIEEIKQDFLDGTTNWDLVGGQARRDFNFVDFKSALDPLFTKLGQAEQNSPERWATDGMINTLSYFSLPLDPSIPVDTVDPRRNEKQHYTAEYLVRWLRERSTDYRPISFFYAGESKPRVRMVNTLDRLELVLISADFRYLVPENFGLKFLADIGEAWGDEDPAMWPKEIHEKYPRALTGGKRPATLKEAYQSILQTKNLFLATLGAPKQPRCSELGAEPEIPGVTPPAAARTSIAPEYVKSSLYNIEQILSVVEENLPESKSPMAGGLKVLRDLFFEMYYSSPEQVRNARSEWGNNLKVISTLVKAGLMRQVSRQMMKFPAVGANPQDYMAARSTDSGALVDSVRSLVATATTSQAKPLVKTLFTKDPSHALIWAVLKKIFVVSDGGGWDAVRMKRLGFYALSELRYLGSLDQIVDVLNRVLDVNGAYLTKRSDKIEDLFRSRKLVLFLQDLYAQGSTAGEKAAAHLLAEALQDPAVAPKAVKLLEVVDTTPFPFTSDSLLSTAKDRFDLIKANPDYRRLGVEDLGQNLLEFFYEHPENASAQSARVMREFAADHVGELEEVLVLAQNHPVEVAQALQALKDRARDGTVLDLVATARRALIGTESGSQ